MPSRDFVIRCIHKKLHPILATKESFVSSDTKVGL